MPIVISSGEIHKLLCVPELPNEKGKTQAEAVYIALRDWGLNDCVQALCCDTTNANLGCRNGAAIILEQILKRSLLYLPCRHHIFEIIIGSVFESKLPGTSGPNVLLFKRFQSEWDNIDKSKYKSGLEDAIIKEDLNNQIPEIKTFIKNMLDEILPRDDYKELLQLCQIFLGLVSPCDVKFYRPSGFHHARWMSKAIYSLKIYIFRDAFRLTKQEKKGLFDICIFIVFIYIKAWYTSPLAVRAPSHDLNFIKILYKFKSIDTVAAEMALYKFINHLWYLSPEAAALAFFDEKVSVEIKRKMVQKLKLSTNSEMEPSKKYYVHNDADLEKLQSYNLDHFITDKSILFFDRFNIDKSFLECDVDKWSENTAYLEGLKIVKSLEVVNDIAERNVKRAEEYITRKITVNEPQRQYLLQVVEEYNKIYPSASKKNVCKKMRIN